MPVFSRLVESHGGDPMHQTHHDRGYQNRAPALLQNDAHSVIGSTVKMPAGVRVGHHSFLDIDGTPDQDQGEHGVQEDAAAYEQRWHQLSDKAAAARKAAAAALAVAAAAAAVTVLSAPAGPSKTPPNLQRDALLNKAIAHAQAGSLQLKAKLVSTDAEDDSALDQWEQRPEPFQFPEASESSLGAWVGLEQTAIFDRPGLLGKAHAYRLPGVMPADVAAEVLSQVKRSVSYDTDEDTVDTRATFEFYPCRNGKWSDEGLRGLLEPFVEGSLLPYCRARYGRSGCALCDVLVRRYLPGERRGHDVHFDSHAFVTAVLGLSDSAEYEGGLYGQPGPDSNTRHFFKLEPGDLVVHSFNLQHGVHVSKGARYSVVFWVKDSIEAVEDGTEPWQESLMQQGHADGLYYAAEKVSSPEEIPAAIQCLERAAYQGHHFAQTNLGPMYYEAHRMGSGVPGALEKSAEHLRRAAMTGFAMAQKNYALAHLHGKKETGIELNANEAFKWMLSAAQQLDVQAAFFVGDFYRLGTGVQVNPQAAAKWYSRSAEAGFAPAQYVMGVMHLEGNHVSLDIGRAQMWLDFAAKQGHAEAQKQLNAIR